MSDSSPAILAERLHRHTTSAAPAAARASVRIEVYDDLGAVEAEWRSFEQAADYTVFQCFDWLAPWWQHIGRPAGVRPAIVVGRRADGSILFLLPLAVEPGVVRRLTWLGSDLCDYAVPML